VNGLKVLPENLRAATKALETLEGLSLLRDWSWTEKVQRWALHCRLAPTAVLANGPVPKETDWFVTATPNYPAGAISFYPAKINGLTQTFPHQSYNGDGDPGLPWRRGDLCLNTSVHALNQPGLDTAPVSIEDRLYWHFIRACTWLTAASRGELFLPGEPYELPQLPSLKGDKSLLAFSESDDLSAWESVTARVGLLDLGPVLRESKTFFVKNFQTLKKASFLSPAWGQILSGAKTSQVAVWIRLDQYPLLPVWQAPRTWGELREAVRTQGIDLDQLFREVFPLLRYGKNHFAMFGFSIPAKVGSPPVQMHWIACELPVLSRGVRTADGFRTNEFGYWMRDRHELIHNDRLIQWQLTENWAAQELTSRGRLPEDICQSSIVMIGGGALGSVLAEMLVRSGSYRMTILDGEVLTAGNLVRHTLGLNELRTSKAESLALRLNRVSPHAHVYGNYATFPEIDADTALRLESADIVIDCTAEDETLLALRHYPWKRKRHFFSLSLGMRARRLFCFSETSKQFSVSTFEELIGPWLEHERQEYADVELPREGVGCWHPVFPARVDDIEMFASVGVKYIERILSFAEERMDLTVYEQEFDDAGWAGIRKAQAAGRG
jgi:molybdopterin/thiamine biosynthesis adenylyltransferase